MLSPSKFGHFGVIIRVIQGCFNLHKSINQLLVSGCNARPEDLNPGTSVNNLYFCSLARANIRRINDN
jgi:hypothetical protein